MKNLSIATAILSALILTSFVIYPRETLENERPDGAKKIEAFSSIEVSLSAKVKVLASDDYDISIEASESDREIIVTKVEDGNLVIKSKKGSRIKGDVFILVKAHDIESLILSGSGVLNVKEGVMSKNKNAIVLAGSGEVLADVDNASSVETVIAGSGNITLSGTAERLSSTVSGSGDVKASEMTVVRAEVVIAGSGDCSIGVKESLDAVISGSGDIIYSGSPKVTSQVMGSGEVRSKN